MTTRRLARCTPRLALPARQPVVALALASVVWMVGGVAGCGGSKPADAAGNPRPTSADGSKAAADTDALPSWQREAIPMPATFTGFPRPRLGDLDGVWLVDDARARSQEVWLVEDQGSKLTVVSADGREQIHGVTLSSPCALRLIDAEGEAQSRAIAQLRSEGAGGRLILTSKGAVAVAAADGSLLACVGHRTYQVTPDGLCRFTTEMLGVWADPVEAEGSCALEPALGDQPSGTSGKRLVIAGQVLREVEPGVWLDELAEASVVTPADSREAALAAIQPASGEDETGGETGHATGDAALSELE